MFHASASIPALYVHFTHCTCTLPHDFHALQLLERVQHHRYPTLVANHVALILPRYVFTSWLMRRHHITLRWRSGRERSSGGRISNGGLKDTTGVNTEHTLHISWQEDSEQIKGRNCPFAVAVY